MKISPLKAGGRLSSLPCVTVTQRNTTHIRNVPFSCFISTEKLISGISRIETVTFWQNTRSKAYMKISPLKAGGRTIKTVIAVFLCFLVDTVRNSNTAFYNVTIHFPVEFVQQKSSFQVQQLIQRIHMKLIDVWLSYTVCRTPDWRYHNESYQQRYY